MQGIWLNAHWRAVLAGLARAARRCAFAIGMLAAALLLSQPVMAASDGCDTINAGALDRAYPVMTVYALQLHAGERITFNAEGDTYVNVRTFGGMDLFDVDLADGESAVFIVTFDSGYIVGYGGNVTVTCTVPPLPVVASISPDRAPATGGTAVTVTGTDFLGTTAVTFGGAAAAFTVVDNQTITATVPAQPAGTVPVAVTTHVGTRTFPATFTYERVPTDLILGMSAIDQATGALNLWVMVTGAGGTPSGDVTLFVDGAPSGSATLSSGTADLSVVGLAAGIRQMRVFYTGDGIFDAVELGDSIAVPQRIATVSLTSTPNPSSFGQPITLTATISAAVDTPTGIVTFHNGGQSLGTAVLSNGAASLPVSNLAVGSHDFWVAYSGDANLEASTSPDLPHQVEQEGTTTSLTSSANPSVFGQDIVVSAQVQSIAGVPEGDVTFYNGGVALETRPLSAGVATLTLSGLAAGSYDLTASYSGADDFGGSTSTILVQSVDQAMTTIVLTSSANPSTFGQAVTFTAQLQSPAGVPEGTVTFSADGVALGSAPLDNGIARYTTSQLGAGSFSIVARYEGSADYVASSSAPLVQAVTGLASLVIRQVTEGSDGAFGFAIAPVGDTIVVTTVAGEGRSAPLALSAGDYTIAADDMRALGFGLTGIACSGAGNAVDIAGRIVRIALDAGEAVVCTFTAVNSAEATAALISDFMDTRAALLLQSLPDSARRIGRLNGVASGGMSPGAAVLGYLPGIVAGDPLMVSGSLAAIDAMAGNAQKSRFDIWMEGSLGIFDTKAASGRISTFALGADYLVSEDLLVGAFAQFDSLRQAADAGPAEILGKGWLAGPYATMRLMDNLYLDLLGAVGGSDNKVSPFGTYEDGFSAERYLLQAALEGSWTEGDWTFMPRARVSYFEETSEGYLDSLGVAIPSITARLGQIAIGPGVFYSFVPGEGVTASAGLRFDGIVDIGNDGLANPHTSVDASLNLQFSEGARLSLDLGYRGVGADTRSLQGKVGVGVAME